jgi:hypothetical protein
MHRIYHDFNKLYPGQTGRLTSAPLVCYGTKCDLERLNLVLKEGMEVVLYEPDIGPNDEPDCLEVKAVIRFDHKAGCFMADFVWGELMYGSERKEPLK